MGDIGDQFRLKPLTFDFRIHRLRDAGAYVVDVLCVFFQFSQHVGGVNGMAVIPGGDAPAALSYPV